MLNTKIKIDEDIKKPKEIEIYYDDNLNIFHKDHFFKVPF